MFDFEHLYAQGHEEVVFFSDPSCGLRAIVAIHDTTLGPGLGGTRLWPYANFDRAVEDVLRLSRGMTYKASISGLHLGGAKGVIVGDGAQVKSEALFRSYGRCVESLGGRYITTEDVGVAVGDMEYVFAETVHVTGLGKHHGGSGSPSPYTALGVFRGMEACCLKVYGSRSLKDKTVAIQGAGSVGRHLGRLLAQAQANIFVCDVNRNALEQFREGAPDAEVIDPDDVYDVACDIYAPCALGAVINDDTVERIKCRIVAGAANNQLAQECHGDILDKKGILYATDYLINAGGLMNVAIEFEGWREEKIRAMVDGIFEATMNILKVSDKRGIPVYRATDLLAEERITSIKTLRHRFAGTGGIPRFLSRKR